MRVCSLHSDAHLESEEQEEDEPLDDDDEDDAGTALEEDLEIAAVQAAAADGADVAHVYGHVVDTGDGQGVLDLRDWVDFRCAACLHVDLGLLETLSVFVLFVFASACARLCVMSW